MRRTTATRVTSWLVTGAMLGVAWLAAGCNGAADHGAGPIEGSGDLIVSDTSHAQGSAAVHAATTSARVLAGAESFAYVSMPEGAVPDGEIAIIRNPRTDSTTTAIVVDGGFDPQPVLAIPGDTIEVDVRVGGGRLLHFKLTVPLSRPPRVVRAQPPRGKASVPVNSRMNVLFSEPVEEATLASSVRLLRGDQVVAGSWHLLLGGTEGVFEPSAPLAPNTPYTLDVTRGVRDLDGEALASAVAVDFTTGTSTSESASEILDVRTVTFFGGGEMGITQKLYFGLIMKSATTFSDSGVNYPLFDQRPIRVGDAGDTLVADPGTDPDFAGFAALVTDGIDEMISVQIATELGSGGSTQPESYFFVGRPGAGPDFAGYTIDRVSFVIDSVRIASPGSDPNHDGNWTEHDLSGRVLVIGHRNALAAAAATAATRRRGASGVRPRNPALGVR